MSFTYSIDSNSDLKLSDSYYDDKWELTLDESKYGCKNFIVYLVLDVDSDCIKHCWDVYGIDIESNEIKRFKEIKLPTYPTRTKRYVDIIKDAILSN